MKGIITLCNWVPVLLCLLSLTESDAWNLPSASNCEKIPKVSVSTTKRNLMNSVAFVVAVPTFFILDPIRAADAILTIDVNNAMAREFTAFPGLYPPTIATKIVNSAKEQPFATKKDVYSILSKEEQERLRKYDMSIIISNPDKSIQQFKMSQICKYECGGRTSSSYRDEQIKAVQAARQQ